MKDSQLSDSQNPYQAPQGDTGQLKPNDAEYAEFNLFSTKGRAGRIRFLLYSQLLPITIVALMGYFLGDHSSGLSKPIEAIEAIVSMVLIVVLGMLGWIVGIQRLHDFNKSGWHILLVVIPFVNILLVLLLLFGSGTEGPNQYGPPSQPHKPIEIWLFWLLLTVSVLMFFLVGVLYRTV